MDFTTLYTENQELNRIQESLEQCFLDQRPSLFNVGDIKVSILTEQQFQTMNSKNWIICDGRSIAGTDLSRITGLIAIPDFRGRFLRMSDSSNPIAQEQGDSTAVNGLSAVTVSDGVHQHLIDATSSGVHQPNSSHFVDGQPGSQDGLTQNAGAHTHAITLSSADQETRPKNVAVNYFIKVN